jgi:hypothetical protein
METYSRIGLLEAMETYSRIGLLEAKETYSRILQTNKLSNVL